MKYAVVKVSNGNFSVVSEWADNRQGAIMAWHGEFRALWNSPDVFSAVVKVVDENLDTVENYVEHIYHVQPETPAEDDTEVEPA